MTSRCQAYPDPSQVSLAGTYMENPTDVEAGELAREVQNALWATGYFIAVPCNVVVDVSSQGHVTLSGIVPSYYLKQQAQVAALSVNRVCSLQNDLVVSDNTHKHFSTEGSHYDHFI